MTVDLPPKDGDSLWSKKSLSPLFYPYVAKELGVNINYIGILPIFITRIV